MDEVAVALQPPLAGDLADYERVLRQRSTLLKTAKGKARIDETMLGVWDDKLADLGARIMRARLLAVARLAPHAARAYRDVAPDEGELTLSYSTALAFGEGRDGSAASGAEAVEPAVASVDELRQALLARIAEVRQQELDRGVCLVGPHRDDLEITIGALPAKGYASHGESWSAALALRLGCFDILTEDADDGEPVLILDDVFAELDAGRRAALAGRVARAGQVLITAAVAEDVPEQLREHPLGNAVLRITPGAVSPEVAHE